MNVVFAVTTLLSLLAGAPAVDSLAWMAGTWQGRDAKGLEMEETWLPPRGGTLLGLHRDVKDGRTVSFEFLRIAKDAEGIAYWASPGGRPAHPFRLSEMKERRVVFADPAHDFPKRILYWLDEAGALHARVEGDDAAMAEEWTWTRAK